MPDRTRLEESKPRTGGIQVLRMETRSMVGGAIACHILGKHVHEVHQPKPGSTLDITVLVDNVEKARTYAKRHMPTGRGRRPDPAIEFVVSGCRPDMTREEQDAYFNAALAWIVEKAGPYSMVAAAAIHRHEVSPHMQVLMVPVGMVDERIQHGKTTTKDGTVRYRYRPTGRKLRGLGWTAVRDRFSPGQGRAADRMSRMQDSFHAEVASRFGIERGEVGSQAVHKEIDRRKAAELLREKAELEEAAARSSAESARADEENASAAADEARKRRDALHAEGVTNLRKKQETEHELASSERKLKTKLLEIHAADSDLAAINANRGFGKRRKRERSLKDREQAVEQRENEIAERTAKLDDRERELAKGQRKVDEERARQDQRDAELTARAAALTAANSELEEKRSAVQLACELEAARAELKATARQAKVAAATARAEAERADALEGEFRRLRARMHTLLRSAGERSWLLATGWLARGLAQVRGERYGEHHLRAIKYVLEAGVKERQERRARRLARVRGGAGHSGAPRPGASAAVSARRPSPSRTGREAGRELG